MNPESNTSATRVCAIEEILEPPDKTNIKGSIKANKLILGALLSMPTYLGKVLDFSHRDRKNTWINLITTTT